MNNYIPTNLKDLTDSKQRVMRNVVNEIENNSKRPKHKWRYVVITAVLTMCAMLFVLNELLVKTEQPSATEVHLDLTKPTFSEEQGLFYLHGVTLGDSQSKVLELLGENYISEDFEDGNRADLILDYDGKARFYFYKDKLDSIVFINVNENYFDKLFNDYDEFKFFTSTYADYDNRFFYSKVTNQVVNASMDTTNGSIHLSLYYPDPDLRGNAEFLMEQNVKIEQQSPTELYIDLTQPTFSEEQGLFYLHGVTLGDSQSKVIERLGENYIIGLADGSGADFVMDYGNTAKFFFYEDKLDWILLMRVDKNYFDQLFKNYAGFKFITHVSEDDSDRFFYSKDTGQLLKATTEAPNEDLSFYLMRGGKDLLENPDFPKWEQIIN